MAVESLDPIPVVLPVKWHANANARTSGQKWDKPHNYLEIADLFL